eukprot:5940195-Alexandrium_andersonii.AAC.1
MAVAARAEARGAEDHHLRHAAEGVCAAGAGEDGSPSAEDAADPDVGKVARRAPWRSEPGR